MPSRGSEGLDFTPILTHYLFLLTSVLAITAWFVTFISQAFVEAHGSAGTLWFAIFLELFLILGVLYTLATDAVSMHRFQISVFGAVAIVFSVDGVQFSHPGAAVKAMSAGWLILSIVNILWVLYFTSEEDSLAFHIFNSMGNGGLTPPSRRRRTRTQSSMQNIGGGNGYAVYGVGGGIGSQDVAYDTKVGGGAGFGTGANALRSQNSFVGSIDAVNRSVSAGAGGGSINNATGTNAGSIVGQDGPHSPLMAGIGAGGSQGTNSVDPAPQPTDTFTCKARALYTYTANPDDPNEISFSKGDVLDVLDKQGKWWQARTRDGTVGIAPSNYLHLL